MSSCDRKRFTTWTCKALWCCSLLALSLTVAGSTFSCVQLSPGLLLQVDWESSVECVSCMAVEGWRCGWFGWIARAQGKHLCVQTSDHRKSLDTGSCSHSGEALTCWEVTAEVMVSSAQVALAPGGGPHTTHRRFCSLGHSQPLGVTAVTLLVKPDRSCIPCF